MADEEAAHPVPLTPAVSGRTSKQRLGPGVIERHQHPSVVRELLASGSDDVIRQAEVAPETLDRFERTGDVVQAADTREFLERLG